MNADSNNSVTQQVEGCIAAENERDDKLLNEVFAKVRAKLSGDRRHAMIQGEQAWLTYRNAWCAVAAASQQPPSPTANRAFCIANLTKQQIAHLQDVLAE